MLQARARALASKLEAAGAVPKGVRFVPTEAMVALRQTAGRLSFETETLFAAAQLSLPLLRL